MQSIYQLIQKAKSSIMRKLLNHTDAEYYLLKTKPTINEFESNYLIIYENSFLMHLFAVVSVVPSIYYFVKLRKLMKIPGFNEAQRLSLSKRCIVPLLFALSTTITVTAYQYTNDFYAMTKQIANGHRKNFESGNLVAIDVSQ